MYLASMRWASGKRGSKLFGGAVLLHMVLAACYLIAADRVVFAIFARVQFSVPSDWVVITSKSDAFKTVFAFQIPNAADQGTPDSTNLAFISYYLREPTAVAESRKKASGQDQKARKRKLAENFAECSVHIRMAWPHLPRNPPDYDKTMETALTDVLKSVAATSK